MNSQERASENIRETDKNMSALCSKIETIKINFQIDRWRGRLDCQYWISALCWKDDYNTKSESLLFCRHCSFIGPKFKIKDEGDSRWYMKASLFENFKLNYPMHH